MVICHRCEVTIYGDGMGCEVTIYGDMMSQM